MEGNLNDGYIDSTLNSVSVASSHALHYITIERYYTLLPVLTPHSARAELLVRRLLLLINGSLAVSARGQSRLGINHVLTKSSSLH